MSCYAKESDGTVVTVSNSGLDVLDGIYIPTVHQTSDGYTVFIQTERHEFLYRKGDKWILGGKFDLNMNYKTHEDFKWYSDSYFEIKSSSETVPASGWTKCYTSDKDIKSKQRYPTVKSEKVATPQSEVANPVFFALTDAEEGDGTVVSIKGFDQKGAFSIFNGEYVPTSTKTELGTVYQKIGGSETLFYKRGYSDRRWVLQNPDATTEASCREYNSYGVLPTSGWGDSVVVTVLSGCKKVKFAGSNVVQKNGNVIAVSNAGIEHINGLYVPLDMKYQGYHRYHYKKPDGACSVYFNTKNSCSLFRYKKNSYDIWRLCHPYLEHCASGRLAYYHEDASEGVPTSGWKVSDGGTGPAPSVTIVHGVDFDSKTDVLQAVSKNGWLIEFATSGLKDDPGVAVQALKQDGRALQLLSDGLKADKNAVLVAVTQNGKALEHAAADLKKDPEIVLAAVAAPPHDGDAAYHADHSLRKDPSFMLAACKIQGKCLRSCMDECRENRDIALVAVGNGAALYQVYNNKFLADREIVLAAVKNRGRNLCNAAKELRADPEIVRAAVQQDGISLCDASDELRADPSIVKAAMTQNCEAFTRAHKDLLGNVELAAIAVNGNWQMIRSALPPANGDIDIVSSAVRENWVAIQYAKEPAISDPKTVLSAISQNWEAIKYASEAAQGNFDVVMAAVTENWNALEYAAEPAKGDVDVAMMAVRQDWRALEYAAEPAKSNTNVIMLAAEQNTYALRYASENIKENEKFFAQAFDKFGAQVLEFASIEARDATLIANFPVDSYPKVIQSSSTKYEEEMGVIVARSETYQAEQEVIRKAAAEQAELNEKLAREAEQHAQEISKLEAAVNTAKAAKDWKAAAKANKALKAAREAYKTDTAGGDSPSCDVVLEPLPETTETWDAIYGDANKLIGMCNMNIILRYLAEAYEREADRRGSNDEFEEAAVYAEASADVSEYDAQKLTPDLSNDLWGPLHEEFEEEEW